MEKVSFKVAKAIKEAGYPQNINILDGYDIRGEETIADSSAKRLEYIAPTYLEVWLWLCNHDIPIHVTYDWIRKRYVAKFNANNYFVGNDPEEAIIAAIEYLVE